MTQHERFEDAAGAYVLGALPEDERAAFAAHLETCAVCQAEVEELTVAATALPMSAPAMVPPPALKARIMAEVEREAALLASAGEPRREVKPKRRRWSLSWPMGAVALACVALVLGLGVGAAVFGDGGRTVPFETDPSLRQASAELEIDGDTAVLVADGLPAPPEGTTYMVWLVGPDGKPKPTSALFRPRGDGSATASVTGLGDAEAVVVNTEASPDVTEPTSAPVLTATLS
jgi:anti-sigma-K factor RskA